MPVVSMCPNKVLNVDLKILQQGKHRVSVVYHEFWLYLQRLLFWFCLKCTESTAYIWFCADDCSLQVNTVNTENSLNITFVVVT